MDWDKLKIFHTVAEASSFTKASTILNLSQSAISRQIQSLENELKIKLFERHARGLALTDNGKYLFKTAHEVITKLKDVESLGIFLSLSWFFNLSLSIISPALTKCFSK